MKKIVITFLFTFMLITNLIAQVDTVSVIINPNQGGEVFGSGEYPTGELVDLEAIPANGYEFINWTENGIELSTDSVFSFIISGNISINAHFELKTYEVITLVEPETSGNTIGEGFYLHGETVIVEAIPFDGYTFVNWTQDGLTESTDSIYSFSITSNKNLIANFELKNHTIKTSAQPIEGGNTIGDGTYLYGTEVIIEAISKVGYNFINWTENGTEVSTDSIFSFVVLNDSEINANFELKQYSIESNVLPESSGIINGSGFYFYGENAVLEAKPVDGYNFINWTENGNEVSTDSLYSFIVEDNRQLTANFLLKSYLINTNANPIQGGITDGGGVFNFGEVVTLTATPAYGYTFKNWTENDTVVSIDSLFSFTCSENRTVIANFSLEQYSVITSLSPPEAGNISGGGSYEHGTMVSVSANSNRGWKFDSWSENENVVSIDSIYSFVLFQNRSLVGNFSKNKYSLSIATNPVQAGTLTGSGVYEYDSIAVLIAEPNVGWHFKNWTENDTIISTDSLISFSITQKRSLVANFEKNIYSILTLSSPDNGGITIGDSNYTHGDQVSLTAISNSDSGYEFINWTENGAIVSSNMDYSFTVSKTRVLAANFRLKTYTVNLSANPNGAGNVIGMEEYVHGDSVTIVANPNNGWLFANWTDGSINVSNTPIYKFKITKNTLLTANFANELYSLESLPEPADAGFISGSGSFFYGQDATLVPYANEGWEFINWTENGNQISTDSILTITITNNLNIRANFKLITYSINCLVSPENAGYTSGCGLSFYNQEMTLNANANNGWEFVNWTENGEVVSTLLDYKFFVNKNRSLTANFDLVSDVDINTISEAIPDDFYLSNAYPNPFNPSTRINFGLPELSSVKIFISNVNGEIVRTILSDVSLPPGNYSSNFNAENLASGIYFYLFLAQSDVSDQKFRKVGKLMLLK